MGKERRPCPFLLAEKGKLPPISCSLTGKATYPRMRAYCPGVIYDKTTDICALQPGKIITAKEKEEVYRAWTVSEEPLR